MNTYTIAQWAGNYASFRPVEGIPRNMTKQQAETLASKARANGIEVVAFNLRAE